MNRALEITEFLSQHGWDTADQMPLEADFSPRRFARLRQEDGRRAILMDADPDQKTPEFTDIAKLLRGVDVSAPNILAFDLEHDLVLMEDFGSRNIGRSLDGGAEALPLYRRATDVLVRIHQRFEPGMAKGLDLPTFGGALFASQVEMFLDEYIPHATGREATREAGESFRAAWKNALKGIEALPQTLMLRDYMPDNLMDLTDGRVGVLDFQDGGFGPSAYDLASLCEVVRRDGGDALLSEMIAYYHEQAKPALSLTDLTRACHVLAAQRHMRILGIIARRARKGQPDKLGYVPRIWAYLRQLLRDEALSPVHDWVTKNNISP